VDTPHSFSSYLLTRQNIMNTVFTDTRLTTKLPHLLLGDCMKSCNTVSTLHFQLSCGIFRAFLVHIFTVPSAINLPHNLATATHVGGGVPNSFLQTFFASNSHFPFQAAFKNALI
jgi:hypothetical protein